MAMLTPESENRRGQSHQEPPDGVLWYGRADEVSGTHLTQRIAFFDRRGLPPSLESLLDASVVKIMVFYSTDFLPASPEATWQRHEPASSTGLTSAARGVGPEGQKKSTTAWFPGKPSILMTELAEIKGNKRL